MNIIPSQNNTNFKGYNRNIANRFFGPYTKLTFMSLDLNNVKSNDLDKWQNIQKKLWKDKAPTPTITIGEHNVYGRHQIVINDKFLKTTHRNANFKKSEEQPILELYTWLADLTKRIMNGEKSSYSNSQPVANFQRETANNLVHQGYDPNSIYGIMQVSMQKDQSKEMPPVANIINDSIQKSMTEYFDI